MANLAQSLDRAQGTEMETFYQPALAVLAPADPSITTVANGVEKRVLTVIGGTIPARGMAGFSEGHLLPYGRGESPLQNILLPLRDGGAETPERKALFALFQERLIAAIKQELAREIFVQRKASDLPPPPQAPAAGPPPQPPLPPGASAMERARHFFRSAFAAAQHSATTTASDVKAAAKDRWERTHFTSVESAVEEAFRQRFMQFDTAQNIHVGRTLDQLSDANRGLLGRVASREATLVLKGHLFGTDRLEKVLHAQPQPRFTGDIEKLVGTPVPMHDKSLRALVAHLDVEQSLGVDATRVAVERARVKMFEHGSQGELRQRTSELDRNEERFKSDAWMSGVLEKIRASLGRIQAERQIYQFQSAADLRTAAQQAQAHGRPPSYISSVTHELGTIGQALNDVRAALASYPFSTTPPPIDQGTLNAECSLLAQLLREARDTTGTVDFLKTMLAVDLDTLGANMSKLQSLTAEPIAKARKILAHAKPPEKLSPHALLLHTNIHFCRAHSRYTGQQATHAIAHEALAKTLLEEFDVDETLSAAGNKKIAALLEKQARGQGDFPTFARALASATGSGLTTLGHLVKGDDPAAWDTKGKMYQALGGKSLPPFAPDVMIDDALGADRSVKQLSDLLLIAEKQFSSADNEQVVYEPMLHAISRLYIALVLQRVGKELATTLPHGTTDERTIAEAILAAETKVLEALKKELEELRKSPEKPEDGGKGPGKKDGDTVSKVADWLGIWHAILEIPKLFGKRR